jgi:hypothetical protein
MKYLLLAFLVFAGITPAWSQTMMITNTAASGAAVPSTTKVPLAIDASLLKGSSPNTVALGPDAMLVLINSTYSATSSIRVKVRLTGATFAAAGTATPYDVVNGALVPLAGTSCTTIVSSGVLTASNCTSAQGHLHALAISGVTYNNASTLATAGQSITATADVEGLDGTIYEQSASATLVVSTSVVRVGSILSSGSANLVSFLRFFNGGSQDGTVQVTLSDASTGLQYAQWTSPVIPAGASVQFPISTIESAATSSGQKPQYYVAQLAPTFTGAFQHVVWSVNGSITNLSTCNIGGQSGPHRLLNVHSSLIGNNGYPATVAIFNTSTSNATPALSVYDAVTGKLIGTDSLARMAANTQAFYTVSQIETDLNIQPTTQHYVITMPSDFPGYLQDLVTNSANGSVSDMTTSCALQ